jgi:hypothetical protein
MASCRLIAEQRVTAATNEDCDLISKMYESPQTLTFFLANHPLSISASVSRGYVSLPKM